LIVIVRNKLYNNGTQLRFKFFSEIKLDFNLAAALQLDDIGVEIIDIVSGKNP
jgi:hypothetical protein